MLGLKIFHSWTGICRFALLMQKYLLLGGFPWTFLLVLFFVANVLFRNRFHSRDLKTISIYTSNEKKLEINILLCTPITKTLFKSSFIIDMVNALLYVSVEEF